MSDVVLDGQFRDLFNERGYIRGTSYIIPDEEMMAVAVDPARLVQDRDDSMVVIGAIMYRLTTISTGSLRHCLRSISPWAAPTRTEGSAWRCLS